MFTKKFTQFCDEYKISKNLLDRIQKDAENFVFLKKTEDKIIDDAIEDFKKNIQNGLSIQNELSLLNKYKNENAKAFDFFERLNKIDNSDYSVKNLKNEEFLKKEEKRQYFENFLHSKEKNMVRRITLLNIFLLCWLIFSLIFFSLFVNLEPIVNNIICNLIINGILSLSASFIFAFFSLASLTLFSSCIRDFVNSPVEKDLIKNIQEYDSKNIKEINFDILSNCQNKIDLFS